MTSTVPEPLERAGAAETPLLAVRDLRTYFKTDDGPDRRWASSASPARERA